MNVLLRVLPLAVLVTLLNCSCQPIQPVEAVQSEGDTQVISASSEPVPESILIVGNSTVDWNLGLHYHLSNMALASAPPLNLETSASILYGSTLKMQWDEGDAADAISQGGWDVVVLQGEIPYIEDMDIEQFYEAVRNFDTMIADIGAKNVLFITWGYPSKDWIDTDGIAAAHAVIAEETGAELAPVGPAFQRAEEQRPELNLYDADLEHPNVLGSYLALNVLYATLFDRSPVGHSYRPADMYPDPETASNPRKRAMLQGLRERFAISEEDVDFLQQVAWETVQEYQNIP